MSGVVVKERFCPKCGHSMEYHQEDYDTGIIAGWSCDGCGHTERDDFDDDDLTEPPRSER
jgi:ribosomal protein S27AE